MGLRERGGWVLAHPSTPPPVQTAKKSLLYIGIKKVCFFSTVKAHLKIHTKKRVKTIDNTQKSVYYKGAHKKVCNQ